MLVTLTSLLYSVSLASVLLPFVAQELPLGEPHRSKSVVGHIYTNLNKDGWYKYTACLSGTVRSLTTFSAVVKQIYVIDYFYLYQLNQSWDFFKAIFSYEDRNWLLQCLKLLI